MGSPKFTLDDESGGDITTSSRTRWTRATLKFGDAPIVATGRPSPTDEASSAPVKQVEASSDRNDPSGPSRPYNPYNYHNPSGSSNFGNEMVPYNRHGLYSSNNPHNPHNYHNPGGSGNSSDEILPYGHRSLRTFLEGRTTSESGLAIFPALTHPTWHSPTSYHPRQLQFGAVPGNFEAPSDTPSDPETVIIGQPDTEVSAGTPSDPEVTNKFLSEPELFVETPPEQETPATTDEAPATMNEA